MATVSYGTITVTDLTDITDVYLEYCMAEAGLTASQVEAKTTWTSSEREWNTIYPSWQSGYEIWIRQVQIKEGIEEPDYGTPYLDTAVNQINTSIEAINDSIYTIGTNVTGLDNRLKTFFWPGDSSYSGAFAVAKTSDDGLNVSNANTYGFNTRVATGLVSIGYNKIPLSEWGINEGLKIYYPILDNEVVVDNKLGMQLTASALNLYNPTLSYKEYEGTIGNPRELRLYEYSSLDNAYILTQDTTFLSNKTYYEHDIVKGLEITAEGIDIYNANGKKGLDIKNDGLVIYDINVTPIISAKQNIFSLGFDTNKYNENFNPADPANLDPFIIWTKQESNEEEIYSLYECVDDIYLRIDENSETQKYSLRNKLKEFNNNIININSSISDIQSDIEDNIKMDIKQLKADVGTNTNNISINTQAIKKIKAYWFIGENEHLTLKEEALNNGL